MLEIKPPSVTGLEDVAGEGGSSGKSHKALGTWSGGGDVVSLEKPSNLCSVHKSSIKKLSSVWVPLCAGNRAPCALPRLLARDAS